jgi:uncharacterized delta-60 repeat protein
MKNIYLNFKLHQVLYTIIGGLLFLHPCLNAQQSALDPSFATNGSFQSATYVNFNMNEVHDMALQADGKILIVGETYNMIDPPFDTKIVVMRLDTSGQIDSTFGFGLNGFITPNIFGQTEKGHSIAVQTDGKIVVAGRNGNFNLLVTRYTPNGDLDTSFNNDGIAIVNEPLLYDREGDVRIQQDGKIVVACTRVDSMNNFDFMVIRLTTDGYLDPTFDNDGIATTGVAGYLRVAKEMTIQNDGKIIVAGYAQHSSVNQFAVIRWNVDGSLDNTFDTDGIVYTPIDSGCAAYSVAIQNDNKIVVSGTSAVGNYNQNFTICRYHTDGSLDNSFDNDGKLIFDAGYRFETGKSVALQADGKIVVGGWVREGSQMDFALIRCNQDGSIDYTFDNDGIITTDFGNADKGAAIKIQNDGKILLAGIRAGMSPQLFTVCRYRLFNQFAGIETPERDNLLIYPNPSSNVIHIELEEALINANLSLTNELGEVIAAMNNVTGNYFNLDISMLGNGVYYFRLQSNNKFYQRAIVKQ